MIKYGAVGASGIAQRRVMPAFRRTRNSLLQAVCSRSQERATVLSKQFQAPGAFDDLGQMLDTVDAVYVATPVHCHLEDARKVLEAGKHLLIEKPLARTFDEAREILALCERHGVFAMEAYMMKFHPAHTAIRAAVQAGEIGKVVYARARLGCWYPDIPEAWRQDPMLGGGGALMDLGSHLINLLSWMLGPIRSIKALCSTQIFSYAVEDSATLLAEFTAGTHGIIEAYFSMPDQLGTGVLELVGTRGRISAHNTIGQDGGGRVDWEIIPLQSGYDAQQSGPAEAVEERTVEYAPIDLYAAQLDYFSQCILSQTPPIVNRLDEGLETLGWIENAYQNQPS